MGKLFSLDAGTKQVVQDALDDLIGEFGKDCLLVYPPRAVPCVNCLWDQTRGASANAWRTGGPMPFGRGEVCAVCGGAGRKFEELSEVIRLLCAWAPRDFFRPMSQLGDVRVPAGTIQTKGYLADAPKIMRCDHLVFQTAAEAIVRKKYRLLSQPGDQSNILQGRYMVCTWEQIG